MFGGFTKKKNERVRITVCKRFWSLERATHTTCLTDAYVGGCEYGQVRVWRSVASPLWNLLV